jgi:hypothetical protein
MTRRKFSREFKIEAVRLVTDRGVAVAANVVARGERRPWDGLALAGLGMILWAVFGLDAGLRFPGI